MKAPHLAALTWLALLAGIAGILVALIAPYGPDDAQLALGALSDLLLIAGIVAAVGAIVLAGVRHALNRLLQLQREERTPAEPSA